MLRSRHAAFLSGALVTALVIAAASLSGPTAAQTPPPATSYLKSFDNYTSPAAPLPLASDATFDIYVHSRNPDTWGALDPMTIDHGAHCEAPPATHPSSQPQMAYSEASFICAANPHWMTALRADGYGVIYGTPGHMVDFSQGEAVIRFDISTLRTSHRDWWDVWVTPFEDNLVGPLGDTLPDLGGEPRRAMVTRLGGGNIFSSGVVREYVGVELPFAWWGNFADVLVPSAVRRDTVEILLSKTHVKAWMPEYNWTPVDTAIDPPLNWDRGIVQFGHHSYTPGKDCGTANGPGPDGTCRANTWHWDNFSISPSAPFTMIRANERAALEASAGAPMAFTFPQAAPQGARLRVSAYGEGYQVSTDNGATWASLTHQPGKRDQQNAYRSYWHAIPAGTNRVLLRTTQAGWWGQGAVEYAAVWADAVQQVPPTPASPLPTATPLPTDTPTPLPASTATPLPTFTPVPQPPTATAHAATATAVSTLAGTPAPLTNCTVTVASNGKSGSWSCP